MMFEDRTKTHNGDLSGIKCPRDTLGLGDAMLDTTSTEHPEGMQGDDKAA